MDAPSNTAEERELLQQLQQGNHLAFNHFYNRYKTELTIRILRMIKSEELAEELLQDLFTRLWTGREQIDPDKSLRAYLYRIAKHLVIDVLRRATKEQSIYEQIIATNSELYNHVEEHIFQKENEALLHQAIDLLPPQRKKIFVHCKLEGMSYKEVAEMYQISTTTVNDHIQKASHTIKDYLLQRPGFQLSVILAVLLSKI